LTPFIIVLSIGRTISLSHVGISPSDFVVPSMRGTSLHRSGAVFMPPPVNLSVMPQARALSISRNKTAFGVICFMIILPAAAGGDK
jgi:hypothetical protein